MTEAGSRPSLVVRTGRLLASLPARVLLGSIWLYRRTLSPTLPVFFGPTCGCRFHPTCAVYAADAVRTHGACRGAWLAIRRLLKCHPLHAGGFDPVPPRADRRPRRRPAVRRVHSPIGPTVGAWSTTPPISPSDRSR